VPLLLSSRLLPLESVLPFAVKLYPIRFEALRFSLEAWPLLARARWALWREPFPAFHAAWNQKIEDERSAATSTSIAFAISANIPPDEMGEPDVKARREAWECAHAVSRAARLVPRASCLTQALALQRLLARRGLESSLFLGVDRAGKPSRTARPRALRFEAHAWVEWRGRILIGGDISRWTPLPLSTPRTDEHAGMSVPESR